MTKKDPIKTQLRIPPELHAQLLAAIEVSGRSMNAEMVSRLAETFDVVEAANRNVKPMLDRLERVLAKLESESERDGATRRLRTAMMPAPKKRKARTDR